MGMRQSDVTPPPLGGHNWNGLPRAAAAPAIETAEAATAASWAEEDRAEGTWR